MSEIQPPPHLLIVALSHALTDSVKSALEQEGYNVTFAIDGDGAIRAIDKEQPDFVVLDVATPPMGGVKLCRNIRVTASNTISIIMLGGQQDPQNRIQAIDAGVNDYIASPFEIDELLTSIQEIARQREFSKDENKLKVGDIEIAKDYWMVWVRGVPVDLTRKEYRLLEELVSSRGRVLSREYLLERVWGYSNVTNMYTRTLEVHMARLRKKLGVASMKILTIRNVGYRINMSPE